MHRKIISSLITQVIICLTLVMQSCRDDSEIIVPYINNGVLDFTKANTSLEEQFKAIWTGMNCNYPIWDYEERHGTNWDDVYDKYIQTFRKLDLEYDKYNPVPDSIVTALYEEMFAPLHDGHLSMYLKNIHTGKKIPTSIIPSLFQLADKNEESIDYLKELLFLITDFKPSLKYYIENEVLEEWDEESDYIYGKFKDGIIYYRLPKFNLTQTFEEKDKNEENERIFQIWERWFNSIQDLHRKNSLNGIIIDVRNNFGGNSQDLQYLLGTMLEGNYIDGENKICQQIGYLRQKSGSARLDYSPLAPFVFSIYNKEHVKIKVPIVVLANNLSISAAEITCIATKQQENGYVIGTKTFGAFSPSIPEDDQISFIGDIGDPALAEDEDQSSYFAPFFIQIPDATFFSMDKEILEGEGIEPNETVHLDWEAHQTTGQDNQLERALDYIRTKQGNK